MNYFFNEKQLLCSSYLYSFSAAFAEISIDRKGEESIVSEQVKFVEILGKKDAAQPYKLDSILTKLLKND